MSIISRLSVVLGLDTAEFNAGLGKAEQGVNKFGAMSGAMKAGIIAAGAALVATAKQAVDFADSINDVAQANEISASKVLEFSQALSVSGGKAEDASKIFSNFTNKIDEAAGGSQEMRDKFAKLGITLKDLQNMDIGQLFEKALKGLSQMPDTITRNALAMDTLGKGIKGVNVKGLNDEFEKINGTLATSDEKFSKIGDALDNFDRLSLKIKTDMANNIAEPVNAASNALVALYDTFKLGNKALDEASKNLEKYGLTWRSILFTQASETIALGNLFNLFKNKNVPSKFTPMDETKVVPSILKSDTPKRVIDKTKEQIAAEEKLKREIESQSTALEQQIRAIKLQTLELDGSASMAEKLKLEFEKGGKYHTQANSELSKQAILVAKAYDKQKELVDAQKDAVQQALIKNQIEMQDREARAQDAANQAIQKANYEYEFNLRLESIDLQKQRVKLEGEIAGYSDIQRNKMLSIFDLETNIIRLKERNYFVTEEQIKAYREANMALIEQEEITQKQQNSFQAGWDRAYNNFVEAASDSARLGGQVFTSMTSSMSRAIDNFARTGKLSFKELVTSMIADMARLYAQAQATQFFSSLFGMFDFGSLFGGSGGVSADAGAYSIDQNPFLNFANGGSPSVGVPSIVGERGPELFVPKVSGTIVPNNRLSSAMTNQPQTVINGPYIANLQTIDSKSFEDRLYESSNAVWAANQYATKSLAVGRGRT